MAFMKVRMIPLLKSALEGVDLKHGDIVIAAITSCTNTSNPSVMIAAGLLARKSQTSGVNNCAKCKTELGAWFSSSH